MPNSDGYRVKDWKQHQHYTNRRPPWVKLHRSLLDDPDYHSLPAESAKILPLLWLIAAEDPDLNGGLPPVRVMAFRLHLSEQAITKHLSMLCHFVEHDASMTLADCTEILPRDRDRDRDRDREETEGEAAPRPPRPRFVPPTPEQVREYMDGRGERIDADAFVDYYASKGWRVGHQPMKDWQAAARGWYRRDRERNPEQPPPKPRPVGLYWVRDGKTVWREFATEADRAAFLADPDVEEAPESSQDHPTYRYRITEAWPLIIIRDGIEERVEVREEEIPETVAGLVLTGSRDGIPVYSEASK